MSEWKFSFWTNRKSVLFIITRKTGARMRPPFPLHVVWVLTRIARAIFVKIPVEMYQFTRIPMIRLNISLMLLFFLGDVFSRNHFKGQAGISRFRGQNNNLQNISRVMIKTYDPYPRLKFRLVLNQLEKCNLNPNLVSFSQIEHTFVSVCAEYR